MNILITGANGFLGSYLVKHFANYSEHIVYVLVRFGSNLVRLDDISKNKNIQLIYVNSQISNFVDKYDIDVIIHTATSYGRKNEKFVDLVQANEVFPLSLIQSLPVDSKLVFINTHSSLHTLTNPYTISKNNLLNWGRYLAVNNRLKFINLKLEYFYGAEDDPSKFLEYIIHSMINKVDHLDLTSGVQKRDFIHVDDVIMAYDTVVRNLDKISEPYMEFGVGTGSVTTIKEIVLLIKQLTNNLTTQLNFGVIPFRENELMESKADTSALLSFGWQSQITLANGLQNIIKEYRQCGY